MCRVCPICDSRARASRAASGLSRCLTVMAAKDLALADQVRNGTRRATGTHAVPQLNCLQHVKLNGTSDDRELSTRA